MGAFWPMFHMFEHWYELIAGLALYHDPDIGLNELLKVVQVFSFSLPFSNASIHSLVVLFRVLMCIKRAPGYITL